MVQWLNSGSLWNLLVEPLFSTHLGLDTEEWSSGGRRVLFPEYPMAGVEDLEVVVRKIKMCCKDSGDLRITEIQHRA